MVTPPPPRRWTADEIIANAFKEAHPAALELRYVDSRSTLDLADGEATLLAMMSGGLMTDPKQAIGAAPRWRSELEYSYTFTWDAAGRRRSALGYNLRATVLRPPRCRVRQLWQRAITSGAPETALAVVELVAAEAGRPQHWVFSITDVPRQVFFRLEVPDDCPIAVEAPDK